MWGRVIINLNLNNSEKDNPKAKLYTSEKETIMSIVQRQLVQYPGMKIMHQIGIRKENKGGQWKYSTGVSEENNGEN